MSDHSRSAMESVVVEAGSARLAGDLNIPTAATGLVIFAHGSGSSRLSPRNVWVADYLNRAGIATLLFDLLTPAEELRDQVTSEHRFDIPLLASRLVGATDWVIDRSSAAELPLGYFGASTGAGAALVAAADRPAIVRAVVSRGGRPDLADEFLHDVVAPTLLVVGELDVVVQTLNEDAMGRMRAETELAVVAGATHLFSEPGTLKVAATHARDWFLRYLPEPTVAR